MMMDPPVLAHRLLIGVVLNASRTIAIVSTGLPVLSDPDVLRAIAIPFTSLVCLLGR